MIEVTFLIPLMANVDNDGNRQEFSAPHFEAFEIHLEDTFGGFTRLPGTADGAWVNPQGIRYPDPMVRYMTALASIADGAKVADTVELVKYLFEQEAVYISYLGVAEIK